MVRSFTNHRVKPVACNRPTSPRAKRKMTLRISMRWEALGKLLTR